MKRLTRFEKIFMIALLVMVFLQTITILRLHDLLEFSFGHDLEGVGWYIKRFIEDYGNYLGLG